MKYRVYVYDNYHYMDESEKYKLGEYETAEEAIKAAKAIVDDFLISGYKPGMTADGLYSCYTMFGEDPTVFPKDEDSEFSAWDYAKEQCEIICNGGFAEKVLSMKETESDTFCEKTYERLKPFFESVLQSTQNEPEINKSTITNIEKKAKLDVSVGYDTLNFGNNFSIYFERTLRIPDDGNTYPLPPGLGDFPVCRVSDYAGKVPPSWNKHGGVFIPMYQREALWINFNGSSWKPCAVKVAVGKINAVTGEDWNQTLSGEKQDYMVCPPQRWLDGVKTGRDTIRQFIAMPLGMGYTVEEQVSGKEEFGGIQIIVFEPKPGKFAEPRTEEPDILKSIIYRPGFEMGIAAGGKIKQKIYEDEYGVDTWDEENFGRVYVHIVNSMVFREITGKEPPPTPITAKTYEKYNLPWFDVYDEEKSDVPVSDSLYTVNSVKLVDKMKGFSPQQDDESINIKDEQIKKVLLDSQKVQDGEW